MIKILLVAPKVGLSGGISTWTEIILQYSKLKKENDVEISHLSSMNRNRLLPQTFIAKLSRILHGMYNYLWLCFRFRRELNRKRYDIVHLTSSASLGLIRDYFLLRIAKKKGVRSILHFHFGRIPDICISKNWEHFLFLRIVRMADSIIVLDYRSYEAILSYKLHSVYCIKNPISPIFLSHIKEKQSQVQRKNNQVLFVGQMIQSKGIYDLLEVCKELVGIKLEMCGTLKPEVKKSIYQMVGDNHDWLHLCGTLSSDQLIIKYLQSSVFVLPSYSEGFPNVIIEAMIAKCPIISTPVGAIPEILDFDRGEVSCGVSVPFGDKERLKDAILKILEDKSYAEMLRENAYLKVLSECSLSVVWDKLHQVWKSLI